MARIKPLLTDRHRQFRLQWAKERKNWEKDQWYKVVRSDGPNLTYLEVMAEFTLGEGKAKIICRSAYSQQ